MPEGCGAHFFEGRAESLRQHPNAVDGAGLALVGTHAQRRVSLDVLDRLVAFSRGDEDICGSRVSLEVDEALARSPSRLPPGHDPSRPSTALLDIARRRCWRRRRLPVPKTGASGGFSPGYPALGKAVPKAKCAVARAGRAFGLSRAAWHEARLLIVEAQLSTGLRVEPRRRVPPSRHRQQVALHPLDAAEGRGPVVPHGSHGPHAPAPVHVGDCMPREHFDPPPRGFGHQGAAWVGPQIHYGTDLHFSGRQVEGGPVGAVVIREYHGSVAWSYAIAVDVGRHGGGQHYARPIIVGEDERALDGAGRQDYPPCPHSPYALPGVEAVDGAEMVGDPLEDCHEVVVVVAEGCASRQQAHLRHRGQLSEGRIHPS